jgi:hypothetical protein
MRIVAQREGPVERDGRTVHLASLAAFAPLKAPGRRR